MFVENCRDNYRSTPRKACSQRSVLQFCGSLSRIFFKQLRAGPVLLDLGMQFVYVVGHSQKKHFCVYLLLTTQKKLPKGVVLLKHTKCTLGLD